MTNNKEGFAMPILIALVAAVLVIAGAGYYYAAQKPQTAVTTQASPEEKKSEDIPTMHKEEMMGVGVVLKNGKIMLEGKRIMSPLEQDYMFTTGVKVTLSGEVIKKDGTTVQLKEGQSVWDDGSVMEAGEMEMMEGNMMMEHESMTKYSGTVLAGKSALLLDFTKADYDGAVKSDKLVILYFYANWCPICKAEFPIMQGAFNELTTDKVIGFRVNFKDDQTDNDETNLAREFGVAYQHTKVFVKNGQRILKSPEGWDDKRYDMEINKALTQ